MSVRFCFGLGREIYELDAVFHTWLWKTLAKVSHRSLQPFFPHRRFNLHCQHCTSICYAMKIILLVDRSHEEPFLIGKYGEVKSDAGMFPCNLT